jgi:hypothetical protein
MAIANKIIFGDNLDVTDEGSGTIRVDATGGSPTIVTERAEYNSSNPTTIANGGFGHLELTDKASGTDLLDISVPDTPTILLAGLYGFSAEIEANSPMSPDGFFKSQLEITTDTDTFTFSQDSRLATAAHPGQSLSMSGVWYLTVGSTFDARIQNFDGVQSVDFIIVHFWLQKLS